MMNNIVWQLTFLWLLSAICGSSLCKDQGSSSGSTFSTTTITNNWINSYHNFRILNPPPTTHTKPSFHHINNQPTSTVQSSHHQTPSSRQLNQFPTTITRSISKTTSGSGSSYLGGLYLEDFWLTEQVNYTSPYPYISPFLSYTLPKCCSIYYGYDTNGILESKKILNMAQLSKRIEMEKCNKAAEDSLFGLDCLVVEMEYQLGNESSTADLSNNNHKNESAIYSSMDAIVQQFLKDLRTVVEREGEKSFQRMIPEGIISLRVKVLSNVSDRKNTNLEIDIGQAFNSSSKAILCYKVFVEVYSDDDENQQHHLSSCNIQVNHPLVFATIRGLHVSQLRTTTASVYVENSTLGEGSFRFAPFLIFSKAKLESRSIYSWGKTVILFNDIEFSSKYWILPRDGSQTTSVIVMNSNITMYFDDIVTGNTMWFINSTIYIDSEFAIEEVGEVYFGSCIIKSIGNLSSRDFASLQISFANTVSIYSSVFDHVNGKSVLGISECIDVSVFNTDFVGHRNEYGHVVSLRNIRDVVIAHCNFKRNWAQNSILSIADVISGFLFSCSFEENESHVSGGGILNIQSTGPFKRVLITSSTFIRNRADSGGAINVWGASVHIHFTNFTENYAYVGGAIQSTTSELATENCVFTNNFAKRNGGAISANGNLTVLSSQFFNNSVSSDTRYECALAFRSCSGNGGAIVFDSIDLDAIVLSIAHSTFENNRAIRGGAISLKFISEIVTLYWENNNLHGNYAKAGGGLFFFNNFRKEIQHGSKFERNSAEIYGNDMATSSRSVLWTIVKRSVDSKSKQQQLDLKHIFESDDSPLEPSDTTTTTNSITALTLFPGETFSLRAISKDYFGSNIGNLWENYYAMLNDSHFKVNFPNNNNNSDVVDGIFFESTTPGDIMTSMVGGAAAATKSVRLSVKFIATTSYIDLAVRDCPENYEMVPTTYASDHSYVCRPLPSITAIVVTSVVSSFIAFTVLLIVSIILGYLIIKGSKKLLYWRERDRAEKDVEKRLFETEISCTKEEIRASEEYSLARKNVFIIGLDQIHIEKKVGEGGAGFVFKGKWNHNTVAIKCLRVEGAESELMRDEIEREATCMSKLRHPNVLMFYGISITPQKHYLVVEYLERGSLENLIVESRKHGLLDFRLKLSILIDVSCGMEYLHSSHIIHRDLKSGNVLLDANNVAKVCDFGLSKLISNSCQQSTLANVGTIFYMANELFSENVSSSTLITPSIDVYSFGIIMYEVLFEERPYVLSKNSKLLLWKNEQQEAITSPFTILPRILKGERPFIPFKDEYGMDEYLQMCVPEYSQLNNGSLASMLKMEKFRQIVSDYVELMRKCWGDDPTLRPNFTTIKTKLLSLRSLFVDIGKSDHQSSSTTTHDGNGNYKKLTDMELELETK